MLEGVLWWFLAMALALTCCLGLDEVHVKCVVTSGRISVRAAKRRRSNNHCAVDYELLIVGKRINREEKRSLIISQLRHFQRCFVCMCVLQRSKFLLIKAETEVTSLSLSQLYFMNFLFCVFQLWIF